MLVNNVKSLLNRQLRCCIQTTSVRLLCTAEGGYTSQVKDTFRGNYDVIIAGGGMVGCTLACAMAKNSLLSNLKVLLLEASPKSDYQLKSEYSNRVVALNQNTKALMTSLNIWKHVEDMRLQPVRYMQVWDASSDVMISFSSADMMDDDVAYIVENDLMLHAINKELLSTDNENTHIVYNAKIDSYQLPKEKYSSPQSIVKMANGDTYTCQLLIGADGANSAVRKAMGVQYLTWSYEQMGVVATLNLAEECTNTTAWQRWLPTGPIALLPLDSKRSSLVWSTWQDNAKQLLQLPEDQFVDALNDALWKQYPRSSSVETCTSWLSSCLKQVGMADGAARQLPPSVSGVAAGSRAAFPLAFGHSTRYIAPGVALIGDAAHRVHPLAGQGVNLGFGDVKDLTELLAEAVYSGLDITHPNWMEKYESVRQRHNVPTQFMIEMLHRLYTVDFMPVVLARSLGLQIANALQPIKKLIMSQAAT
ncbi:ubiquinone biosynthesis monooxygenase COQ6, mitochondrial [Trichoplusia ni]|uniref:Ubiquinone biosynthesis monooxygenase COQ6, mitochondrial n=1 Tax=Trichoplusia ni TaxID=7111 RepID=A0A7E5W401_TRINI|nr:ubiquinone biosynthesis monooxygenase COQ6, mitochondrial [Trichoplusia ni]